MTKNSIFTNFSLYLFLLFILPYLLIICFLVITILLIHICIVIIFFASLFFDVNWSGCMEFNRKERAVNKDECVIIASRLSTLFDLTKTCAARGMHIHCQFPYSEFKKGVGLEKELGKCGIASVFFREVGLIKIKKVV